jgi:hypothetical protein
MHGAGYKTITDLLMGFNSIGCLPRTLNLSRLDDGDGIEATLRQHKAKWHDSCRLEYNKTKLQRAEKRKRPAEGDTDDSKKFTRQSVGKTSTSVETCFFCDKPAAAGRSSAKHQHWRSIFMFGNVPTNCRISHCLPS